MDRPWNHVSDCLWATKLGFCSENEMLKGTYFPHLQIFFLCEGLYIVQHTKKWAVSTLKALCLYCVYSKHG